MTNRVRPNSDPRFPFRGLRVCELQPQRERHETPNSLAAENWRTQNEPADAVLLVQAALKANQPKLAEPVLGWMAATGYTDPVLKVLADELQTRLGKS